MKTVIERHPVLVGGAAAIAALALYLYGAAFFPLTEPDEGRYAEIAREMLVRGDWVTPHLNFVKYFEKPPLVYWTTAAAFEWRGLSELAARLPSIIGALLTLAGTVVLAVRMYGAATATLSLVILAFSPLFGFMAQTLTLDMSLTGWMTLAMASTWLGWNADGDRRWYRVAYVATALAVLVKGPVAAVLVGAVGLIFLLSAGGWRALRAAIDGWGVGLALSIVLPWFALVSWRNPEFLHFFVVDQHIARYLWTNEHGEPFWYYLPVLPIALLPWALLPLLDPPVLRATPSPRQWAPSTRFLVIWAGVIVVFFSLSTSKLLTYILPALPPLAILLAGALRWMVSSGRLAAVARLAPALLVAGVITALCGVILPLATTHRRIPLIAPYLVAGGAVLAATGWSMGRARQPAQALALLAIGWAAFFGVAVAGRGAANDYRALGLAARAAMQPEDRLVLYRSLVQGVPFYAQRRAVMASGVSELKFGSRQGDHRAWFWPTDDDLRREWSAPGRLFLVINRQHLDALSPPLDPPPIVVAEKDKKVLVVNRN